jgi:hypothetical protein
MQRKCRNGIRFVKYYYYTSTKNNLVVEPRLLSYLFRIANIIQINSVCFPRKSLTTIPTAIVNTMILSAISVRVLIQGI